MVVEGGCTLYFLRNIGEFESVIPANEVMLSSVVLSDDVLVLEHARAVGLENVFFSYELGPLSEVCQSRVYAIVDQVNASIKRCLTGHVPYYLVHWVKHLEGGDTGPMAILDAVLRTDVLTDIFDRFSITNVVFFGSRSMPFVDLFIVDFARSRGVPHTRLVDFFGGVVDSLGICKSQLRCFGFSLFLPKIVLGFIRHSRLLWKRFLQSFLSFPRTVSDNPLIGFSLYGDTLRHKEQLWPVMDAFFSRGYTPVVCGWELGTGDEGASQRYPVVSLEKALTVVDFFRTVFSYFLFRGVLLFFQKKFSKLTIEYNGVNLTTCLAPFLDQACGVSLLDEMFLRAAGKSYFSKHSFRAFKLWGQTILPLGYILANVLKREIPPDKRDVLLFEYPLGVTGLLDCHAYDDMDLMDVVFVVGQKDKELLEAKQAPYRVCVSGLAQFSALMTLGDSARARGGLNIVFISSGTLIGLYSSLESFLVLRFLVQFAREHPHIHLVIKLHPCEDPAIARHCYELCGCPSNVSLVADGLAYLLIAEADLVISKISTCIIETLILKKPVISIVLDGGAEIYRSMMFEDGVEMFSDLAALEKFLCTVFLDPKKFKSWVQIYEKKGQDFVQNRLSCGGDLPEDIIAGELIPMIEEKVYKNASVCV